ncbi:MAG: winged helix-turn-helix domain-containing protein [Sulfolobaceae archaeon]
MKFEELPCSAKLVYKVLEYKKKATFRELKEETALPERTIRHALKILKDNGLVDVEICLWDLRKKYYVLIAKELCAKINEKENLLDDNNKKHNI